MFANLFKPKWRHSDPEVRLNAVSKLCPDQPEQAGILRQMALHDNSQRVRVVAVSRLCDTDSLIDILSRSTDPEVREHAGMRVSECLPVDGNSDSLSELLKRLDDADARTHIILNVNSEQLQQSALNSIEDETVLMQVALNARLATMRREAAQRVERTDLLENLQRQSRGRDKTVHRISRDKLTRLREQARREAKHEQRRGQLLEQLEQLATGADIQFLHARSQALVQEWQQLPAAPVEAQKGFEQWQNRIKDRLATVAEAEQHARNQKLQHEQDQIAAANLIQQFEAEAAPEFPPAESLQALQQQWNTLADRTPLSADLKQQWNALRHRTERQLAAIERLQQQAPHIQALLEQQDSSPDKRLRRAQRLQNTIDWPASRPVPKELQSLQTLINQLKQTIEHLSAQANQQETELQHQLEQLEQLIDQGETSAAKQLHAQIAKQYEQRSNPLPDALESRYRQLDARLIELKDWQGFAANGKKEQLCEQMEGLIGAELPPQALADQVRLLQQEWKEIDHTDPVHSQKLWKRFHEAGEKAYAPCQQWFGSQRRQREFNLTQRQQICSQLGLYLEQVDWSQADWPAVEAISRTAREEWRKYTPVDRAPGKPLQQQFNALLRDLDQHIKQHRQQCADTKEALIVRAAELAEAEDASAAAEEAKQLQQQWKAAGPTFRSRERALWQAFREQCDIIFARLKAQRKEQAKTERQQAGGQRSRQLVADSAVEALQRLALLAEQAEEELANSGSSETLSTLLTEAITGPSPGDVWRERIGHRLEAIRLISAGNRSIEQQIVLSERQARELCIRLEIVLSLPSPEEDEALRMEYQMERLSQALAQQDDEPTPAALQALELEWLTLPFAWQFGELQERFAQQLQSA